MQVLSNLEAAKEATEIFNQRNNVKLPANITETPKFHEAKSESIELSDSAKETFTRIGARAREAFIEDQIERAIVYGFVAQIKYLLYFPLPWNMGLTDSNRNWFTNLKHFV